MPVENPPKATPPTSETAQPTRFSWLSLILFLVCPMFFLGRRFWIWPMLLMVLPGVIGLVYLFLVTPILLKGKSWMSPTPEIRTVHLDEEGLLSEVIEHYHSTVEALARLGFVEQGFYFIDKTHSNASSYVGYFDNRAERTIARWLLPRTAQKPHKPILAFVTKFADGSEFLVSNSSTVSYFPKPKSRKGWTFAGIEDPARLWSLHRRGMALMGEFSTRVNLIERDTITYIRNSTPEEMARMATTGYYRFDETSHLYQMTLKGAYLSTWKHLWPWGPIRRAYRRRLTARRLREWEGSAA